MKEETPGIDIHNRQRLLNSVQKALSESSISGRNKELTEDFDKATKQDMEELEEKISSLKVSRGGKETDKPISDLTRYDYMVIVRTFYRWLTGKKEPDIIEDFIPEKVKNHRLHPKDILIWDDVVKLSRCGTNPK